MKTPTHIQDILNTFPDSPGVYCMKNRAGTIIYVGKSVNLHSRVSSYWGDEKRLNFAKQSMITQVRDIEIIETRNELEALVLETNLIKEKQPKYNVLMKDGKNLAYIHITDGPVPEVIKTRIRKPHGTYFGPYTAGANVTEILKVLKRIFQIRSCKVEFIEENGKISLGSHAGRSIPCLDFFIGLCPAPCVLEQDKLDAYNKNISNLRQFLSGKSVKVVEELRARMQERAKKLEFEEAQKLKLQIEQIEKLGTKQSARDSVPGDYDAIVSIEKYGKNFVGMTEIRGGHIIGVSQIEVENVLEESPEWVLSAFLAKRYLTEDIPGSVKILLKKEVDDPTLMKALWEKKREIEIPQIGPKVEILQFAEYNLLSFAQREEIRSLSVKAPTRGTHAHIMERLGYEPKKSGELVFECYDISHTSGQFTVASRSVIVNGKPEPSRYRKYKIKTLQPGMIDDFASIREVLYRRTLEGFEQNNFPDMIIIDGGKGQLSSALSAMERGREVTETKLLDGLLPQGNDELTTPPLDAHLDSEPLVTTTDPLQEIMEGTGSIKLPALPCLASIAKREEEVFVPYKKEPVMFDKGSLELMLLQKLRDESHRFAIGFNRTSRSKAMKKNILEELPGFGPATRKKLLKLAGSVDHIGEAPEAELEKILTKAQIETLKDHGILKSS